MQWSGVCGFALLAATAWAGPVKLEPAEVDFGTKGQGLHLEAVVKITNSTTTEIHVLHVSSDCSCAAGQPQQQRLAPGESTTMPVGMDTRTYLGPVVRRLVVHTSAGDAELRVKATIRPFESWEVAPMPLMLRPSRRNQEAAKEVTAAYTGTGKERRAVLSATTDQPWLQAELATTPSQPAGRVTLRKLAAAPAGPNTARLILATNDPTQPRLVVSVYVPVLSDARVSPNPVILPTTKAGSTATREFVLSGWEEGAAPLVKIPTGRVEARGRRPNGDYVFLLSITPQTAGMSTQMLQLALHDNTVLIEVPVLLKAEP